MALLKGYSQLEEKLQSLASPGIRPGLARLSKLLSLAGHPERKFKAVHIVGTNGKGSTAATLASILSEAGYRTALYTSPHLVSFGERLMINGAQASADKWLSYVSKTEQFISNCSFFDDNIPTYFELITAIAFMIIADEDVDIAIIEAGMGGRLDASNILAKVILSVIVPIGLDHTEYLGGTLVKVANEKFAVMRPGVPAIFAGGADDVEEAFFARASLLGAPAQVLRRLCSVTLKDVSLYGTDFCIENECLCADYHTPLVGTFQADNAALAVMAANQLIRSGFDRVDMETIQRGVAKTRWPGRFNLLRREPPLVIDGGHNPHAMKRIVETIGALKFSGSLNIVLAMMKDKDISDSLLLLKPLGARICCTEVPAMERCMSAGDLCELVSRCGLNAAGTFDVPTDAVNAASADGGAVVCCGSLYLVGYLMEHVNDISGI